MSDLTRRLTAFGECMIEFSRTADGSAWVRKFAGDTFNTAWYFRRLSPPDWETAYFTTVGDDAPSRDLVRFMEANGIATDFIRAVPNSSPGLYLIELEGAERHFSYWRDQSAAKRLADDREHLAAAMGASEIVYFSGITLAILAEDDRAAFVAALAEARRNGRTVAFDPNIRPRLWPDIPTMARATTEAAAAASIVFPTFPDEQVVFGDADLGACAERYRRLGAETVVVKNGEHACLGASNGELASVDAVAVPDPVDTTGAGDLFNGAFLAARLAGAGLSEAIASAHSTAAHTICGRGALVA